MGTIELFREDAYLRSCTATVRAVVGRAIVLDRTVFYPEGGGQPGDRGRLEGDDGRVYDIEDTRADSTLGLCHLLAGDGEAPAVGTRVTAAIDWERRYRHMRVHTTLHLLCALLPYAVTGGAIAAERGRLDFDTNEKLDREALERGLNELIVGDRAVTQRWIADAELDAQPALVRTAGVAPPRGGGRVRLVEIDGVDLQPCGGTHVARTAEIGRVTLGKIENKGRHNRRVNVLLATP